MLVESDLTPSAFQSAVALFTRLGANANEAGTCYVGAADSICRVWACDSYAQSNADFTVPVSAGSVSVSGTQAPLELAPHPAACLQRRPVCLLAP